MWRRLQPPLPSSLESPRGQALSRPFNGEGALKAGTRHGGPPGINAWPCTIRSQGRPLHACGRSWIEVCVGECERMSQCCPPFGMDNIHGQFRFRFRRSQVWAIHIAGVRCTEEGEESVQVSNRFATCERTSRRGDVRVRRFAKLVAAVGTGRLDGRDRSERRVLPSDERSARLDKYRTKKCKHCREIAKKAQNNPETKYGKCKAYWKEIRAMVYVDRLVWTTFMGNLGLGFDEARCGRYISRAFAVLKKAKNPFRLVIDLRHVNAHHVAVTCELEDLRSLWQLLEPGDWMVAIDLSDGYYRQTNGARAWTSTGPKSANIAGRLQRRRRTIRRQSMASAKRTGKRSKPWYVWSAGLRKERRKQIT